MSIASNVILENQKLATALNLLRNKITDVRGSSYYEEENLRILLKRFMAPNKNMSFTNSTSDWFISKGETKTGVIAGCEEEGEVIAVYFIDNATGDETYLGSFISNSNGRFSWTYTGQGSSNSFGDKTISFRGVNDTWNQTAYTDALYAGSGKSEKLASESTIVKYPTSTSASVTPNLDYKYERCILFSKTSGSQEFAYLYPNIISSSTHNLHVRAMINGTHTSTSDWREGIYLTSTKNVNEEYPVGFSLINTHDNCKLIQGNGNSETILASYDSELETNSWYYYDLIIKDLTVRGIIYDVTGTLIWDSGEISISESIRTNYYPALYIGNNGGMYCSMFYVLDCGD